MRNMMVQIWESVRRAHEDEDLASAELSPEEWRAELDRQTRTLLGMPSESFVLGLSTGELDRNDWRVEYLAGLAE